MRICSNETQSEIKWVHPLEVLVCVKDFNMEAEAQYDCTCEIAVYIPSGLFSTLLFIIGVISYQNKAKHANSLIELDSINNFPHFFSWLISEKSPVQTHLPLKVPWLQRPQAGHWSRRGPSRDTLAHVPATAFHPAGHDTLQDGRKSR